MEEAKSSLQPGQHNGQKVNLKIQKGGNGNDNKNSGPYILHGGGIYRLSDDGKFGFQAVLARADNLAKDFPGVKVYRQENGRWICCHCGQGNVNLKAPILATY